MHNSSPIFNRNRLNVIRTHKGHTEIHFYILDNDNSINELNNNGKDNSTKMYFGTVNLTTLSTQVGSIAVVPCEVHHIGEGVVSILFIPLWYSSLTIHRGNHFSFIYFGLPFLFRCHG